MKKDNVPQDEGFLGGKTRDVCYALDENGNYVQVLSVGWEPKNAALEQALNLVNEQIEDAREKVLKGQASPIFYFMEKNLMDLKILSQYTGISKWKIKRHFKPAKFIKLKDNVYKKYADTFNISVDELTNFTKHQKL
ncbi:MAG: hypothetical protein A2033_12510 [Bacteroidetes bacterium GWA2_31_9]|nr:MAG: hypothetical protein A2033_12510 [Bacteroidetes bacterium GWA2_31_9]